MYLFIMLEHEQFILTRRQFYCKEHVGIGESFARFAFCKDTDTLHKAAERLQGLGKFMRR